MLAKCRFFRKNIRTLCQIRIQPSQQLYINRGQGQCLGNIYLRKVFFLPEHCSSFWQSWTVSWVRCGIWIIIFNSQGRNHPSQIFPIFLKHAYPFLWLQLVVMSHSSIKHHVKAIVFWLFKTCCRVISLLFSSHLSHLLSTIKPLVTFDDL